MKVRLDILLVERGLFSSREKAKAAVMAGLVTVDGVTAGIKPGMSVSEDADIEIKENSCPFVSRGGLKLQAAIDAFDLDLRDAVCIDVGASTGGFTDCMLKAGARLVYAIDVGYGQLDWKLRNDDRVVNMERVNFRYLEEGAVPRQADFITADVSFISLSHIFPVASTLLKTGGKMVCLVKPQFEAGKTQVGKHGIVRDEGVHAEVLKKVSELGAEDGLRAAGIVHSPIKGAKGNIEYLMLFIKDGDMWTSDREGMDAEAAVSEAFYVLGRPGE